MNCTSLEPAWPTITCGWRSCLRRRRGTAAASVRTPGLDGIADRRESLGQPVSSPDCLCSATVNEGQLARSGQCTYGASGTGPSD